MSERWSTGRTREEILTQCYGDRPGSRTAEQISRVAKRSFGDGPTVEQVVTELLYLQGRGFVEAMGMGAPSADRWRLTAAGTDFAERELGVA